MLGHSKIRTHTGRRLTIGSVGLLVATLGTLAGLQATAQAATTVTCFGKRATIVGNGGSNTIHGTRGNDVIYAGNGNDQVYGEGGNDLICGGYGADRLHGGPGNDWLDGGLGAKVHTAAGTRINGDALFGEAGNDFLSPGFDGRFPTRKPDQISFFYSPAPVTVNTATHTSTGEGADTWLGDRAELVGSSKGDTFIGGPQNDTFQGGAGADTFTAGAGNDVIRDDYAGAGSKDRDNLGGGLGNDQLFTQGGFDTLDGGDGNDVLSDYSRDAGVMRGGTGDDVINDGIAINASQVDDGGPGVDKVNLYTDMSRDSWPRLAVDLSQGTGTFKTSTPVRLTVSSADNLYVHGLPLSFVGDAGNNAVYTDGMGNMDAAGNAGNDTFIGSLANDAFNGGPGSDTATTNGGRDTCISIETLVGRRCTAG